MTAKKALWLTMLSGALFVMGCTPTRNYNGYDSYYGGSYSRPYGIYDPYYGGTYYGGSSYDPRSHGEVHQDLNRTHEKMHENLEQKYDKATNRLDRQEREAQEKAYRKYDGNVSDPRYREALEKTDRKYDHKRDKVERNLSEDHREGHQDLERGHDHYHGW